MPRPAARRSVRRTAILAGALVIAAVMAIAITRTLSGSPDRLRAGAERAARSGDWREALRAWRALNATTAARGETHLAEARACLALGLAAQAERSLRRAVASDPADPEPWRLLLEILRVEDRMLDARRDGWEAYEHVPDGSRPEVLRALTLALLADLPDERVRAALSRWIAADPDDIDARVALSGRVAAQPRAGDPDRRARLDELEALVAEHPGHPGAREALAIALGDSGEIVRGRAVLDAWPGPEVERDGRYWRLRGRWDLEFDRAYEGAVSAFRRALEDFPQDWRSWSGLARALNRIGREAEAREAAVAVARIREALEPAALGARLDDDLRQLDDPRALRDLADLADHAGLSRLAAAWRALAESHGSGDQHARDQKQNGSSDRREPPPTEY